MKKKIVDRIYMIIYGIIGAINLFLSMSSFSKIHQSCDNNLVRDGLTTIVTISAVLITVALSYLFCNWRSGDCYAENEEGSGEMYMYIGGVVSLLQIALLGTILSRLKGGCIGDVPHATDQQLEDGKTLKFNVWSMIALNILILFGSIGGVVYINAYVPSQLKKKSSPDIFQAPKESEQTIFAPRESRQSRRNRGARNRKPRNNVVFDDDDDDMDWSNFLKN